MPFVLLLAYKAHLQFWLLDLLLVYKKESQLNFQDAKLCYHL